MIIEDFLLVFLFLAINFFLYSFLLLASFFFSFPNFSKLFYNECKKNADLPSHINYKSCFSK